MYPTSAAMAPRKGPAIGIDLGTWKCCVAVVREGKVEVIENERGSKTTPSYVAFTETERLVGEDAKDQVALNPTNTVFGVKRIIGRRFDDPDSTHHLGNFHFKAREANTTGGIEILVQYKGTEKVLPPEHITAMLLRKMKLTAEAYLGCSVQEAVVSVPSCFNSGQRQATLDAAEIAGLKVLQLLHEPTAVALAYKDQVGAKAVNPRVIVVDAGGGTLEVSIVIIKENAVKVLATSSDDRLGGLDLDQLLVDDCVQKLQFGRGCDLSRNKKALERLRHACQKAKYSLSLLHDTVIFVDSLVDGIDFKMPISRDQFSQLLFAVTDGRIKILVRDVLQGAQLSLRDVDQVIVVGGSTRVPSVITSLQEALACKNLNKCVNADEAVAHGAALQAALLAGDNSVADTTICEVSQRDFFLVHKEQFWWWEKSGVVLHKNTSIPCERVWDVSVDRGGRQTLYLYEGNNKSNKSHSLPIHTYTFQFGYSLKIWRTIPVRFSIDENGLFSAPPRPTGEHTRINVHKSSSPKTCLTKMREEEQSFQRDEQEEQERVQAISKLESSCFGIKTTVKDWKTQYEAQKPVEHFEKRCDSLLKACDDTFAWLDLNPNTGITMVTQCQTQLDQDVNSLVDLLSSAPQSGGESKNVPYSPGSNGSQSSREILHENSSEQSSATVHLSDKTRTQSRSNLITLQTNSVNKPESTETDGICFPSDEVVENVDQPLVCRAPPSSSSKSTLVLSHDSEPHVNRVTGVDKTSLNSNKINFSSGTKTYERRPSATTEVDLPKSGTSSKDAFPQKSSMESNPLTANTTKVRRTGVEVATNETSNECMDDRTSNVSDPIQPMPESYVSRKVETSTSSTSKSNVSESGDLSDVMLQTSKLSATAGRQPTETDKQIKAYEQVPGQNTQATAGVPASGVNKSSTAGEKAPRVNKPATAGEQTSVVKDTHQTGTGEQGLYADHGSLSEHDPDADRESFDSEHSGSGASNGALMDLVSEADLQRKGEVEQTRECRSSTAKTQGTVSSKDELVCVRKMLDDCRLRIHETQEEFPPHPEVSEIVDSMEVFSGQGDACQMGEVFSGQGDACQMGEVFSGQGDACQMGEEDNCRCDETSYSSNEEESDTSCINRKEVCDISNSVIEHREGILGGGRNREAVSTLAGRDSTGNDGRMRGLDKTEKDRTSKDSNEHSEARDNTDGTRSCDQPVHARSGIVVAEEGIDTNLFDVIQQESSIWDAEVKATVVKGRPECRQLPTGIEQLSAEEQLELASIALMLIHLMANQLESFHNARKKQETCIFSNNLDEKTIEREHFSSPSQIMINEMKAELEKGKYNMEIDNPEISEEPSVNHESSNKSGHKVADSSHVDHIEKENIQESYMDNDELREGPSSMAGNCYAFNSYSGYSASGNTKEDGGTVDSVNRGRGAGNGMVGDKFCCRSDEVLRQCTVQSINEDDVGGVCIAEQNTQQNQPRPDEKTCSDDKDVDAANCIKLNEAASARSHTGGAQLVDTNSSSKTRRASCTVAERLKKEGNKGKSTTSTNGFEVSTRVMENTTSTNGSVVSTRMMENTPSDETADAGSATEAVRIFNSATSSYVDGSGDRQRTGITEECFIDSLASARQPKEISRVSRLDRKTASVTEEGPNEKESAQILCMRHLQTNQNLAHRTQSQQGKYQPHQEGAQSHQEEAQSQQEEALSHQEEAQSQQEEALSHQEEAQSQQEEALSHQEEAQSQQEEAQSQQEEAQSQQEEAQSQQEEALSHQEEAQSQQEEAQSHQEEAQSQQEEAQSQQEEAQSQQEEAQSQQEEAQSQQEEALSHQEEAQSQQEEAQSQQEEALSHQEEAQSQQEEAQSQQEEAQSQQEEAQSQQEEAQSQQEEALSHQEEALSHQEEAQSQQEEAQSQQEEVQSQQEEAQSHKEEDQSHQEGTQSHQAEDQSHQEEDKSQQEGAQSQSHEVPSQQHKAQSQQHKAKFQQHNAQSQQQEDKINPRQNQFQQPEAQIKKQCNNKEQTTVSTTSMNASNESICKSEPLPTESDVSHTQQNSMQLESVRRTAQRKSQPVVNGCMSSKEHKKASSQQESTPDQQNKRPEQHHDPPNQEQQSSRPHVTSQQKTSSTHQRNNSAIGIDLGTWKCCVAVVRAGKVEVIENERGSKTTPSYVAFTETERLVGEDAKDQVALNPTNTVFGVKRIIGRSFDDQSLQNDMKLWPYTVSHDKFSRPRIPVRYRKGEKVLTPELVSAMMLEKMKCIAESHLGCEVIDAVISVPACFNNAQRQATKDAAVIAGLNVLGLISEPTAAALAYRDNKVRVEPHHVLIFDLGGGTFDVAVIRVDESGVKVLGVCGDTEFGGNEMDVLLMERFDKEFTGKYGKSVLQDKKGIERLRTASEKAKKTLTLLPKANVQVDSLIGDVDFNASIKRHDFEQLFYANAKEKIESVLESVVQQARIQLVDIDELVLVGGTSRIPKVQSILKEFFGGKALNKTVNPDEAVAHGAALQAALLAGNSEVKEVHVAELVQDPVKSNLGGQTTGDGSSTTQSPKYLNRIHIAECLTEAEVTQVAAQVRQFGQDDQELKEGVAAMSDLEAFCFQTKAAVTSSGLGQKLGQGELKDIAGQCEEMICWLDDNDSETKSEYQRKKKELCGEIFAVVKKGNVKMEDFHGADLEWFKEIYRVERQQSMSLVGKVANEEQLNSTPIPLLQQSNSAQPTFTHPHNGKPNSAQPSLTPPHNGKPNSAQLSLTPPHNGKPNSAQPSLTPPHNGKPNSAQLSLTPPHNGKPNSAQPSPTPPHNGKPNSAQPSLTPPHNGKPNSAQPSPTPPHNGKPNSAQPSPTPPHNGKPNSAQPSLTPPCNRKPNSAQSIPHDKQLIVLDESEPKHASESKDIYNTSKENRVESFQSSKNLLQPTKLDPFPKYPPKTRPEDLYSKVFSSESNQSKHMNSFTPDPTPDTGNSLSPRSQDSGTCSPCVEVGSPEATVGDLIGSEFTSQDRSDSGHVSPLSATSNGGIGSFGSSATHLPASSKGKPDSSPERQSVSHPECSYFELGHKTSTLNTVLRKNVDGITAAQKKLSGGLFNDPLLNPASSSRNDFSAIGREETDQESHNDKKDTTTITLWSGGSHQPASIFLEKEKNNVGSQQQDMDTIIKSLITSPVQPSQESHSNVPSDHKHSSVMTRDRQCLRVTPAAISNDPHVDLSLNTKTNLNKIEVLSPCLPRMKLPNTVLSHGTPSYKMAFSDRLRDYRCPSPHFTQLQTVHCNSFIAPQQQPNATEGVHSAGHGHTDQNNRDPLGVSPPQPDHKSIEHVPARQAVQHLNSNVQQQIRPIAMEHGMPATHQQQKSCEGRQEYISIYMGQGNQRGNSVQLREPPRASQKDSPV